jgi:hypothetical protein
MLSTCSSSSVRLYHTRIAAGKYRSFKSFVKLLLYLSTTLRRRMCSGDKHPRILEISSSHGGEYGMLRRVVWYKFADVSEVLTSSIALMIEAVSSSETLVNIHQTTRYYIPEDSRLRAHRCENLKPHKYHRRLLVLYATNRSGIKHSPVAKER